MNELYYIIGWIVCGIIGGIMWTVSLARDEGQITLAEIIRWGSITTILGPISAIAFIVVWLDENCEYIVVWKRKTKKKVKEKEL